MEHCLTENSTRCELHPKLGVGANEEFVPCPDCIIPVPQGVNEPSLLNNQSAQHTTFPLGLDPDGSLRSDHRYSI